MKKFIAIMLILISIMTCSANATSEDYIPSEISIAEVKELQQEIQGLKERMDAAHQMAEAARLLGYSENHYIIQAAKAAWEEAEGPYNALNEQYKEITKAKQLEEYPVATEIWYFLKEQGYNDYVCAGILGNIMAEVGGQTLNIQYWLGGKGYYGMCQWSNKYHPDANGLGLMEQLEYLQNTIEYEINTFGYVYKSGFDYDKFLSMADETEAALAFAKTYERCAKEHYYIRTINATKAYNYFVG